jgi:hypothetical protein
MSTITNRVGLGRNLTAAEVDANFNSLKTDVDALAGITVQEEGVSLATAATIFNFVGDGVTASGTGATKTITISDSGTIVVQDEGSPLTTAASTLNFVGTGVTASGSGATKTITVNSGGDAITTAPLSQFAATTSAQLAGVLTTKTGFSTGAVSVFSISPSLETPVLGVATATSINKVTITAPATSAVLTIPNGVTLTGPASSGTAMTLGNTETVTGIKTFGSAGAVGRLKVAGTTSGAVTIDATAVAGTGVMTLPVATDTFVGKATTDTFTNKTYDTAGGGNSFSINGLAATSNTGTGSVARATSPTFVTPTLGVATATTYNKITLTAPATGATLTLIDGTTITGPATSGTLVVSAASVDLTGANTLTTATHSNRHLTWTGSSTAAQALPGSGQTAGDFIELTNDGTAIVTFTGITPLAGFKASIDPGETFQAVYSAGAWVSLTPFSAGTSPINSQSSAYGLLLTDAGKTIYHPSADTTARIWTIPANASVAFPIGTVITFDNDDAAGAITIAITSDTMVLVGTAGSTGSRLLAEGGRAVVQKVAATRWRISGGEELT